MDIQIRDVKQFEQYCINEFSMCHGEGDFEIDEHGFYECVYTERMWRIWELQAAKAQAVPEGFTLVSQKELLELTIAINAVDLATHTESKTNEVREMWQQVALKLMALGTTQEPK